MQFISIISALFLLAGSHAWVGDGKGNWVANNNWYTWKKLENGGNLKVHEACTIRNRNDYVFENSEPCWYWTNAQGGKFKGHCTRRKSDREILVGCY
ncbi:unnamed protein product [Clonostachys chloroleuca]|uniref:Uncharacterized protein n=1 Tax=Clonostachys chloroleuca TaxID=1926264 RepID=A0AA35VAP9_9HYPO|nr:unnamed protein product [Clonostachys chloroleuca]